MNNRPFIYKTDRPDYKFGYLEWKPEVGKTLCFDEEYKSCGICTNYANGCDCYNYEYDQKLIDQSRVPVSEELKKSGGFRFVMKEDAHLPLEYIEGRDFTLSGGVAVPVKEEPKNNSEDLKEVLEDKRRLTKEIDVILNGENAARQASLCDIVSQIRDFKSELSRLKSENEELRKKKELIITETKLEFYEKLNKKLEKVMDGKLDLETWWDEVSKKIDDLKDKLIDLEE